MFSRRFYLWQPPLRVTVRWDGLLRRAFVFLMLLGYAAANIGYPSYRPAASKQSSEPFPCQHSACGCRTAEQCRRSCCCHTREAKIAWALERRIDPNRVAILTPEESARFTNQRFVNCCKTATKGVCCQKAVTTKKAKHPCCEKPSAAGLDFVVAIRAQDCRGSGVDWIQAGFVALPPDTIVLADHRPAVPEFAASDVFYSSPIQGRLDRPG